jgi:hypothetical protein
MTVQEVAHLRQMLQSARKAKTLRGIECDLSWEDMLAVWKQCDGRCALTGMPFDWNRRGKSFKRPFAPSLDRISAAGGYTRRNVRLVTVIANYVKCDYSDKDFIRMAVACAEFVADGRYSGRNEAPQDTVKCVTGSYAVTLLTQALGPGSSARAAQHWREVKGKYAKPFMGRTAYKVPVADLVSEADALGCKRQMARCLATAPEYLYARW